MAQARLSSPADDVQSLQAHDHRRLGRELDLFSFSDEVGAGLPLWHPKGALVRWLLEDFWRREHLARGYDFVATPHVGRAPLWETSGHLDFYRDSMYPPMAADDGLGDGEQEPYYIKPMNCPFHIEIYRSRRRSYRDLPLRFAELGTVYRHERSGVRHGLLRVRGFTQDDAHIFCREDQLEDEIVAVVDFARDFLKAFGLDALGFRLATRPEKAVGSLAAWELAIATLRRALERAELPFVLEEGGGAFYGPKLDVHARDAHGRDWQLSTVQFDFNLPERFGLGYAASDGSVQRPYVIHRALFGSLERFFGILVEHYVGAFPFWLAPVQARVVPVSAPHRDYARDVADRAGKAGLRVEVDDSDRPLGARIRDGELEKIPELLVVGERELAAGRVSVRSRGGARTEVRSIQAWLDAAMARSRERLLP